MQSPYLMVLVISAVCALGLPGCSKKVQPVADKDLKDFFCLNAFRDKLTGETGYFIYQSDPSVSLREEIMRVGETRIPNQEQLHQAIKNLPSQGTVHVWLFCEGWRNTMDCGNIETRAITQDEYREICAFVKANCKNLKVITN
jgi:hypothetical protein